MKQLSWVNLTAKYAEDTEGFYFLFPHLCALCDLYGEFKLNCFEKFGIIFSFE